jgi:hypothetical protein
VKKKKKKGKEKRKKKKKKKRGEKNKKKKCQINERITREISGPLKCWGRGQGRTKH